MSTVEMNAKIIKSEDLNVTSHLLGTIEGETLQFTSANGSQDRALEIDSFSYGDDYLRKSDWMRLVNKLNRYDDKELRNKILGDYNADYQISNVDLNFSNDGLLIEFAEPVQLVLERIGLDRAVVVEVSKLKGELTWEWASHLDDLDDLDGLANHIYVYIHNIKIIE